MKACFRKINFSSGHRVMGHEGACAQPHGHNYCAIIYARGEKLDDLGRVIDFAVLKDKVGGWIQSNWDHGFIVFSEDGDLIKAISSIPGNKLFTLPRNPTAENIADYLLREVCPIVLKDNGVEVYKVIIHETDNCSAMASL